MCLQSSIIHIELIYSNNSNFMTITVLICSTDRLGLQNSMTFSLNVIGCSDLVM